MSFAQRLEQCARLIDARLAGLIGRPGAPGAQLAGTPDRLVAAMAHATLGAGKRFRPFLVIETASLFRVPETAAADAATAIELIHCYSLVHDDLPAMDNDSLRRGQPTVWKAFDEWTAILAGDALQTLAFAVLADPRCHPDADIRTALLASLAHASGAAGMAGGQALDLEAGKLGRPAVPDVAHIRRLQAMKTGALIVSACEMGAILGGAGPAERNALNRYGAALGFAFQIADDLLDAEGDAAVVGKAVAKDGDKGKATLVSLLGVDDARAELVRAEAEAQEALGPFGDRADVLRNAASFVACRNR